MDVQGFAEHLNRHTQEIGGGPLMLQTAKIHISNIAKIECALGNLIRKGMERRRDIYNDLVRVTNDEERNESQVKMRWDTTIPPNTINPIRDSMKKYCEFLGDTFNAD